jgi:hypothetical protein
MKLAWMLREITKGQLFALHAGRLKDKGELIARAGLAGQDEQRRHRAADRAHRVTSTARTASSTSTR